MPGLKFLADPARITAHVENRAHPNGFITQQVVNAERKRSPEQAEESEVFRMDSGIENQRLRVRKNGVDKVFSDSTLL